MNDEFLKSYQGLPTSLLNLTESIQPSALLAGCQFDTRDCAHDTCSSDCVDCSDCSDCSDCYDTPPVTYPYISSDGSTSSSISWTFHHGTQSTYNYFRTIVKRGTTTIHDSGWSYETSDYYESLDGLSSGTTYTVYLYYSSSGSGAGTSAGSVSIKTQGSPPSPTYTITATVNFDAVGGLVSPTSITEKGYGRPNPYGTLSIDFPTPTRDGYTFLYWLLDGYATHWPAGANDVYATSSGETYTARAQWKPSPTYTITATVNFDAVGGLVSPTSITEKGYGRTKPYGTVSIDFPTPTRDGYIFLYWLLDGYTTHWPAGANDVYATSSGETYTARAQWEKQTAGKAFIGDGGVWKQAVPYIGDGGVWKPVSESIGDGGTWK